LASAANALLTAGVLERALARIVNEATDSAGQRSPRRVAFAT